MDQTNERNNIMAIQEDRLNIAAAANISKKPSKKVAHEIIKELYAQAPDDETSANLAKLYKCFMPPIPKTPKTPFDWVAGAMGVKDVRYYLNYVRVNADYIEATDGHRAHRVANTDGLPAGFYNKAGDKVHGPNFADFPDISRVIPAEKDYHQLEDIQASQLPVETWESEIIYRLPNGAAVSKRYLDKCIGSGTATIGMRGAEDAIRVDMEGRVAVIMPLRDR
jgi:hypothetical protein